MANRKNMLSIEIDESSSKMIVSSYSDVDEVCVAVVNAMEANKNFAEILMSSTIAFVARNNTQENKLLDKFKNTLAQAASAFCDDVNCQCGKIS